MKIPLKILEFHPKGHVVGCGMQGDDCLALDVSQDKGGKWSINWSLAGKLGDESFASLLSQKTGARHFWVSPCEEGGLQVEAAMAIDIPNGEFAKGQRDDFFLTQVKGRFVDKTIVFGGLRLKGEGIGSGAAVKSVHNVGGGAIDDNVKHDYRYWYSVMGIRRPHIASTAMALANAYLALYPIEKRRKNPLRLVVLEGRSVSRAILMDDWKYIDEVLLPRMVGDDATADVIAERIGNWINEFHRQHAALIAGRAINPLIITVREEYESPHEKEIHEGVYEHWDLWGEYAMEKIVMTEDVAEAILLNRDIAPVAFGMALQGGC